MSSKIGDRAGMSLELTIDNFVVAYINYLVATTILPALGEVSNVKGRQREDGRCTWFAAFCDARAETK